MAKKCFEISYSDGSSELTHWHTEEQARNFGNRQAKVKMVAVSSVVPQKTIAVSFRRRTKGTSTAEGE